MRALGNLALLALGLASCGWNAGLVAPEGYRSIGVEVFETRRGVLQRGLEPDLSDAITEAVTDLVAAPLLAPDVADAVVRGRITAYHRRSGIRTTGNQLAETGVFVSVTAELIDRSTGAVLVPGTERHVWSGFALDADTGGNEARARRRALRHVADSLVLDLFGIRTESGAKNREQTEPILPGSDPAR